MQVKSRNHIYHYVPDYRGNRKLSRDEQIVIDLEIIGMDDDDAYQRASLLATRKFSPEKAQELNEKRFRDLVAKKFHGVSGLEIEGCVLDLSVWDNFYAEAPREIVAEVIQALRSTDVLTAGEQKNFLPESDGPLSAPAPEE